MVLGALMYILSALREARFLGAKMFFENLVMRLIFKIFFLNLMNPLLFVCFFRARHHRVYCFYSHVG